MLHSSVSINKNQLISEIWCAKTEKLHQDIFLEDNLNRYEQLSCQFAHSRSAKHGMSKPLTSQ